MKRRVRYILTAALTGAVIALSGCAAGTQGANSGNVSSNDYEETSETPHEDTTEENSEPTEEESQTEEKRVPAESVSLENEELVLEKGDTHKLKAAILPKEAEANEIKWISLDPTVALVNKDGLVTARQAGSTKILAFSGKACTMCSVTVKVSLQGIKAEDMILDITDKEVPLKWSLEPEDTTEDVKPFFEVSDSSIVTINEEGILTPVSNGTAAVTITAGSFTESCEIKVITGLKEISFTEKNIEIDLDEKKELTLKLAPENVTELPELIFKSSAPDIISVDKEGVITAHKKGSAEITVTAGKLTAKCSVKVHVPVTGIAAEAEQISLVKGQTFKLNIRLLPADTTERPEIVFSSSNPGIASVDAAGNITALAPGNAVIAAAAGGFMTQCAVSIASPLQSVALNYSDITLWSGETAALSVSFIPADTTDSRAVTFTSSNPAVADVDQNGLIRAVSDGTCNVTATCGNVSAACIVRVRTFVHVSSVALSAASLELNSIGQTAQLAASAAPANATNPAITFTSSNPRVASVSPAGLVTAVSGGSAVITATADGVSASCSVFVNLPPANKIVVLDAGHGGADPGAGINGLTEKDMTLKVALYAKEYLEANYSGVTVLLTRDSDTQLAKDETNTDLRSRCYYAASVGADCLVSLHFNTSPAHNAQGALALISMQPSVTAYSAGLANSILNQLSVLGLGNRGAIITESTSMPGSDYYAINRISAAYGMPGIIVEHCFMDNAYDVGFCNSDAALRALAAADAVGIAAYLGLPGK